jgi:hypothetical protein
MEHQRSRLVDIFYLIGAAFLVCVLGLGAFLLADIYHISPLWVFFGFISVLFVAMAREDYPKQFRSPRFLAFVMGWGVITIILIIFVVSSFDWIWLIPALLLDQAFFYVTASWLFDVSPPKRRWPFQRARPSDGQGSNQS